MSTLATHVVDISDGTVYDIPAFIAALAGSPGADGSDGADGADGLSLLSGSSNPTTEGVNGDFYINTTSTTLFGPKAAGTWPSGVSLIGPAGATGAGSGDALVADPLSQFAATTSAQLAGVISDETGSGALVFANSPVFVTPALGTPVSGNLANCTFPTLNQNTTGNADTATYATVAGSASLASYATLAGTASSAATLTTPRTINGVSFNGSANITIIPRIASATSTATLTVDADTTDEAILTAQAAALAIAAPTGTPVQGQRLVLRIKDNGTARAFTWNAIFRAFNVVLPPTTKVSTTLIAVAIYNATDTKWDVVYAEFEGVKARGSEALTGSTPTPNWGAYQQSNITASSGITIGEPTGTFADARRRVLRIEDNGSSQTLAFNAIFRAIGFTLPTATVAGKVMYLACISDEIDTKWNVLSYRYEV